VLRGQVWVFRVVRVVRCSKNFLGKRKALHLRSSP
jgi:hypothetical protein